jgi:hypothetical protein
VKKASAAEAEANKRGDPSGIWGVLYAAVRVGLKDPDLIERELNSMYEGKGPRSRLTIARLEEAFEPVPKGKEEELQ